MVRYVQSQKSCSPAVHEQQCFISPALYDAIRTISKNESIDDILPCDNGVMRTSKKWAYLFSDKPHVVYRRKDSDHQHKNKTGTEKSKAPGSHILLDSSAVPPGWEKKKPIYIRYFSTSLTQTSPPAAPLSSRLERRHPPAVPTQPFRLPTTPIRSSFRREEGGRRSWADENGRPGERKTLLATWFESIFSTSGISRVIAFGGPSTPCRQTCRIGWVMRTCATTSTATYCIHLLLYGTRREDAQHEGRNTAVRNTNNSSSERDDPSWNFSGGLVPSVLFAPPLSLPPPSRLDPPPPRHLLSVVSLTRAC